MGANSETDSVLLTDAVASDPVLALSVLAVAPISTPSTGLKTTSPETTAGLLRALAVIGSGFGEAGTDFIEQMGTAPAAITDMAAQVEAGILAPDDAIRWLAAASLNAVITGTAKAIGHSIIHEVFEENSLIPILDAATIAPGASNGDPRHEARATDATETAEDPAAVVDSTEEAADNEIVSGNTVVEAKPQPPRNRAFRLGQILNRMSERLNQRLKDLQERLAGTDKALGPEITAQMPRTSLRADHLRRVCRGAITSAPRASWRTALYASSPLAGRTAGSVRYGPKVEQTQTRVRSSRLLEKSAVCCWCGVSHTFGTTLNCDPDHQLTAASVTFSAMNPLSKTRSLQC